MMKYWPSTEVMEAHWIEEHFSETILWDGVGVLLIRALRSLVEYVIYRCKHNQLLFCINYWGAVLI